MKKNRTHILTALFLIQLAVLPQYSKAQHLFEPQLIFDAGGAGTHSVTIRDLNDDNLLDISAANWLSDTVSVMLGNGDGTFLNSTIYKAGAWPKGVAAEDINNDGIFDLVVPNYKSNNISILLSYPFSG